MIHVEGTPSSLLRKGFVLALSLILLAIKLYSRGGFYEEIHVLGVIVEIRCRALFP